VRIIPMDGRPHVPSSVRQLGGDSRGHWEGDTLVVDTTNFTDATNFRGPPARTFSPTMTCTSWNASPAPMNSTIAYRFTVDDPSICQEGNYGLPNILAAARAKEK
jgi:hypothetical protein